MENGIVTKKKARKVFVEGCLNVLDKEYILKVVCCRWVKVFKLICYWWYDKSEK